MKRRLISLACWVSAVLVTIALSVLAAYYGCFAILALASIIWAAVDCKRARLWRYQTGVSGYASILFFLLFLLAWPIVFPWYLGMRFKIWAGVAQLRKEHQPWRMSDQTIGVNGLVQPWRGRRL